MSVDSTLPADLSTFKSRAFLNLRSSKPLQSTQSEDEPIPKARNSLKSSVKDRQVFQSRGRTKSTADETALDTIAESIIMSPVPKKTSQKPERRPSELKPPVEKPDRRTSESKPPFEKLDRRPSDSKPPIEKPDHTHVEHRNSIAQIHFSSLLPHAFRNPKHNQKTNAKDETHSTTMSNLNHTSTSISTSSTFYPNITTMKIDPNTQFKSSTTTTNGSRLISSNSNERLILSQHADSISSSSFVLNESKAEPQSTESFINESHTSLYVSEIYNDYFFDSFHINYYGEFDVEGPFIASLRCINNKTSQADTFEARAIIRTQSRNCDVRETLNKANENNILQILLNKAQFPFVHTYGTVGDPKANEKIYFFDKTNDERYNCKVGVIYQRTNQTNEQDIFNNDNHHMHDMLDFLTRISDRVCLKGFPKYRGDLDTTKNLHGEYSYYAVHENHEIMFNVAPIISSAFADDKCTIRKSLVGNAFVCVVFQEPGASFSPDFISGKVTQIYITVQPITRDGQLHYKIGVWRRNDITTIIDPPGGTFIYDKSFSSYFLTLLLNTIDVAIKSPSLHLYIYEQRQRLKYEELKRLSILFSHGPIPDFTSKVDDSHTPVDIRPEGRSESFSSNVTVTASDAGSANTGRTSPVSTKKKGFSKIFDLFSGRSGSVSVSSSSTSSGPSSQFTHEVLPNNPLLSSMPEAPVTSVRTITQPNKENDQRIRSTKTTHAPMPLSRPSNSKGPYNVAHHPSISSATPPISSTFDNMAETNLINTAALAFAPRSRSNSSPEDTVNINKSLSFRIPPIVEDDTTTSSEDDEEDEEDSSEEGG